MDYSLYTPLEETLSGLGSDYCLLDRRGICILPKSQRGTAFAPEETVSEGAVVKGFHLYRVQVFPQLYFAVRESKQSPDIARLACAYIKATCGPQARELTREGFYRQCLLGQVAQQELPHYQTMFHVEETRERYLIVLRDRNGLEAFSETLEEIFPAGSIDVIVRMDHSTIAVVLGKNEEVKSSEQGELAAAIENTAQEIGYPNLKIGIGEPRKTFDRLCESYQEAIQAIEIGELFEIKGNVYFFRGLLTERFLRDLPEDLCRRYYGLLFNKKNTRLLGDEMQRTIRIFMECNLNLSEAARYIFIHRNTLVYRLDKIQAATGLDLRVFDDAASFKLLMQIGQRLKETN